MESGTTVEICLEALQKLQPAEIATAIIVDWYNSSYKIASGKRPRIDFAGGTATMWPDFPWEH
jgi:hypoxanthine phosphoribosyltransferase